MSDQTEQAEPLQVSGIGAIRAHNWGDRGARIEVWNESSDEPGHAPYLVFGEPIPEDTPNYRQRYLPRAAWTVTSGGGVMVLSAEALLPLDMDPRLAALDAAMGQWGDDDDEED